MTFEEWQQNPYTKVLQDSIARDYVPAADVAGLVRAEREACAKVCEEIARQKTPLAAALGADDCYQAIYARSLTANTKV